MFGEIVIAKPAARLLINGLIILCSLETTTIYFTPHLDICEHKKTQNYQHTYGCVKNKH